MGCVRPPLPYLPNWAPCTASGATFPWNLSQLDEGLADVPQTCADRETSRTCSPPFAYGFNSQLVATASPDALSVLVDASLGRSGGQASGVSEHMAHSAAPSEDIQQGLGVTRWHLFPSRRPT